MPASDKQTVSTPEAETASGVLRPYLTDLLTAGSAEELFQRVLAGLVAPGDGVEQAFLLRRDANGNFNLSGVYGLDEDVARGFTPVAEAATLARYPLGERAWREGTPHVAVGVDDQVLFDVLEPQDAAALTSLMPAGDDNASLTIPLVFEREVWALVSLHGSRDATFCHGGLPALLERARAISPIARDVYLRLSAERRCRWLEAINGVLGAPQDEPLHTTMRRALERVITLGDVDGAELVKLGKDGGYTLAQAGWTAGGASRELLSKLVLRKLEGGEQISIPRYGLWPEARPALVAAGLRSLAIVPMLRPGGESGALLLYTRDRFWLPDAQTSRLLADMAMTLGVVRLERQLLDQLHQAAYTDSLTGLSNRRAFTEDMQRLEARADAEQALLLLLDLDQFKEVNDSFGHVRADHALARLGGVLRANARGHDGVYRIGGDEFAILLRGCPAVHAESVAARYQSLVEAVDVARERSLGASVGCAHYPQDGRSAAELWRVADAAMYRDKGHPDKGPRMPFPEPEPLPLERRTQEMPDLGKLLSGR